MNLRRLENGNIRHWTLKVGSVFRLITDGFEEILAPVNTVCICVNTYETVMPGGIMLFPNGNYDGFNYKEIKDYLRYMFNIEVSHTWKFSNVADLTLEYQNSTFDKTFQGVAMKLTQCPYTRMYRDVKIHTETNTSRLYGQGMSTL